MKKIFFALTLISPLFSESLWDYHPLHIGSNGIAIGSANVDVKNSSIGGGLYFNKVNAFTYMLLPINRTSYFFPRVEYNYFTMNWNKNPKFNETKFSYIQFALTFLTTELESWRWIARVDYNIDAKHFSSPRSYGLFSLLFWGTHELHKKWHYHIGALGYSGFKGDQVYPVIGFDFSPNKKWMFQAVFPINYSIEYAITNKWRLMAKIRPLKERFKTGKNEPQPRSIFSYTSSGAELNIHYEKFLRLELEAFIGYNFGGDMYIKNSHGHSALYTKFNGAPYLGFNLNWGI